jgi:hypothetical protein
VPAVFEAGRSFPVPVVSFDLLDNYANETLALAEIDGMVLENSGDEGYHITLNTDDTLDIRVVTAVSPDCRCDEDGHWKWCATYGIDTEVDYDLASATPPNGIVFVKDNVWIDGQIDGNRINIVAFEEPLAGNSSNIIINNDLLYTNYDGSDTIGLVAQSSVLFGLYMEEDLRVDAAIVAKEEKWGRYNYANSNCDPHRFKTQLTTYGSLASRESPGVYFGAGASGINSRTYVYDNNLTYAPPPHFPSTGEYTFLSWEEE